MMGLPGEFIHPYLSTLPLEAQFILVSLFYAAIMFQEQFSVCFIWPTENKTHRTLMKGFNEAELDITNYL